MLSPVVLSDIFSILQWWLILLLIGLVSWPVGSRFFSNFLDKGYIFSKVLGTLFLSYLVWLLSSFHILKFSPVSTWFVFCVTAVASFFFLRRSKVKWKLAAVQELAFLFLLFAWSIIRGFQPDIRGLEKFMDFGFVNSILMSNYFPPADMWFAGEHINYYYFGHLVTAVLTNLSSLPAAVTYNLMIATIFALTFLSSFSIGVHLYLNSESKKARWYSFGFVGTLSALLVSLGSNLHPLYWFISKGGFASYWYPDATRFIVKSFGAQDNTIHEFPIYSFVVADLHGHLINLPNVILFIALCLSFVGDKSGYKKYLPLFGLLLAIFYMTNTWDFPIYLLLFSLSFILKAFKEEGFSYVGVLKSSLAGLSVGLLGLFLSLPFHVNFENISKGVALADFHSPFWMLLVLWGFPLLITAAFCAVRLRHLSRFDHSDVMITAMLAVSWFLVVLPEVVYVKDIYVHDHQRANTMFKFTYQSFVMFYLLTPVVISKVLAVSGKLWTISSTILFLVPVSAFLSFVLVYPYFAIRSFYGLKNYQGLSGDSWVGKYYPHHYAAILWLQNNIKKGEVVVEATGDSYTDYGVISSYTGAPTIQGWLVHEWLWRGSYDEPGRRVNEVQDLYLTDKADRAREILDKYNVSYVVIGALEKQRYPTLQESKFAEIGRVVFSSSGTRIYKID